MDGWVARFLIVTSVYPYLKDTLHSNGRLGDTRAQLEENLRDIEGVAAPPQGVTVVDRYQLTNHSGLEKKSRPFDERRSRWQGPAVAAIGCRGVLLVRQPRRSLRSQILPRRTWILWDSSVLTAVRRDTKRPTVPRPTRKPFWEKPRVSRHSILAIDPGHKGCPHTTPFYHCDGLFGQLHFGSLCHDRLWLYLEPCLCQTHLYRPDRIPLAPVRP